MIEMRELSQTGVDFSNKFADDLGRLVDRSKSIMFLANLDAKEALAILCGGLLAKYISEVQEFRGNVGAAAAFGIETLQELTKATES